MSAAEGIAVGAAAVAGLALVAGVLSWWNVRAVRKAQLVLLGGGSEPIPLGLGGPEGRRQLTFAHPELFSLRL